MTISAHAAASTAVTAAQDELTWTRAGEPLAELIERVALVASPALVGRRSPRSARR